MQQAMTLHTATADSVNTANCSGGVLACTRSDHDSSLREGITAHCTLGDCHACAVSLTGDSARCVCLPSSEWSAV